MPDKPLRQFIVTWNVAPPRAVRDREAPPTYSGRDFFIGYAILFIIEPISDYYVYTMLNTMLIITLIVFSFVRFLYRYHFDVAVQIVSRALHTLCNAPCKSIIAIMKGKTIRR